MRTQAAINLKPYQGLKHQACLPAIWQSLLFAAINLKPYQGLKQLGISTDYGGGIVVGRN